MAPDRKGAIYEGNLTEEALLAFAAELVVLANPGERQKHFGAELAQIAAMPTEEIQVLSDSPKNRSASHRHSTAQHSAAQHSTAQHSTAQRSTAQHSTAQHKHKHKHSTAQHSTAPDRPDAQSSVHTSLAWDHFRHCHHYLPLTTDY